MTLFSRSKLALSGVILAGGVLAGCTQAPVAQMESAKLAVNDAVTQGATQFAPYDMQMAQEHLRRATLAMDEKEYKAAKVYAERAEWDARVADRRAQAEKIKYVKPKAIRPVLVKPVPSVTTITPLPSAAVTTVPVRPAPVTTTTTTVVTPVRVDY